MEKNKGHYKVLARKYRPTTFDTLVGQEALVRTFTNAILQGRIAHAFILTGIRGIGKTTTARIIARALNCIGEDGRSPPTAHPCGTCVHCVAISEDRHTDVIEMDAASRTGVDDIRDIIENVSYAPGSARYKIYIIDEVHMLSKNAFNALLKTLEEPPSHVKFIFATTEIRKIPVTILSRCQRFDLRRVSITNITAHLSQIAKKENITVEDEALNVIANAAEGSMRDALSLLDQAIAHSDGAVSVTTVNTMLGLADKGKVLELFEAIASGTLEKALACYQQLHNESAETLLLFQDLTEIVHLLTKFKIIPQTEQSAHIPETLRKQGKTLADKLDVAYLGRCWQMLLKGIGEIKMASHPVMAGEMAIIRLAYMSQLPSPADIIKKYTATPVPVSSNSNNNGGNPAPSAAPAVPIATSAPVAPAQAALPLPAASPASLHMITDFQQLVELFKEKEEFLLYNMLYHHFHLINFAPGRVEIRHDVSVPPNIPGQIARLLQQWTGIPWVMATSKDKGMPSLAEQQLQAARDEKEALAQQPLIKEILDAFPGATITAVSDTLQEEKAAGTEEQVFGMPQEHV